MPDQAVPERLSKNPILLKYGEPPLRFFNAGREIFRA
jgi:hypothetical protein